ncbi:hypothetical protein GJ744_004947 [Endocarpon pusillum]|uniref:Uncharacterized protein n=1 Tax=Endocarpon pusillum TaxID=364733 RepID=A0A8H7A5C3_9EURO|nr:hypothetical protein GJ744_004947 [Endocarpon pusillum]
MPDAVKKPGWNRHFKSHDRVNKRLMTGAEAAERDANNREQAAGREARQREREAYALTFGREPILQMVSVALSPPSAPAIMPAASGEAFREPLEEEEEEEEEGDPFIPPPSTAPAMIQVSRAGRKRAPTIKALEAEKAPKRGRGSGRGSGKGKNKARAEKLERLRWSYFSNTTFSISIP